MYFPEIVYMHQCHLLIVNNVSNHYCLLVDLSLSNNAYIYNYYVWYECQIIIIIIIIVI